MSITTRMGDEGCTSLIGQRVCKSTTCLPLLLNGKLDQLNAALGMVRDWNCPEGLNEDLANIQGFIVYLSGEVASADDPDITDALRRLEYGIRDMENDEQLAVTYNRFILPSGSVYVTRLHFARTVCREAELVAWDYVRKEGMSNAVPKYLNRLADWLFIRAQFLQQIESCF